MVQTISCIKQGKQREKELKINKINENRKININKIDKNEYKNRKNILALHKKLNII